MKLNAKYFYRRAKIKIMNDYLKYRGKCKELAEQACKENKSLRLIRGWYICPVLGKQQHWWAKDERGIIHDPSKNQFPSKGTGEYIEFDGYFTCEVCGKIFPESELHALGSHTTCSYECYGKLIM